MVFNEKYDEDILNKCPKCRTKAETHVHTVKESDNFIINDVGWRCPKCGHEWGFEYPKGRYRCPEE